MKKRLALLFCVIASMFLMCGCKVKFVAENENFNKSTLKKSAVEYIEKWFETDYAGAVDYYDQQLSDEDKVTYADALATYAEYGKLQKKYGAYEKVEKVEYTINTDTATVTMTVKCKKGRTLASVTFDENGSVAKNDDGSEQINFNEYKTLGDKMKMAALNTVLSMAIVFIVLIFIALLISCFKFIGIIQNKANNKAADTATVEAVAAPAVTDGGVDVTDDLELVAVITAAIAAATESESTDGLVVRSIIRRS